MKPSAAITTGATIAVLAIVGGILAGRVTPDAGLGGRYARILWDGGRPTGVECIWVTARTTPAARALFGLDADGGVQYARVRVCAAPADGGVPLLPEGMEALPDSELADGGDYQLEAWLGADAPFPCACSSGNDCWLTDGGAAPSGITLPARGWTGTGCVRRPCVVFSHGAGGWDEGMPASCRHADGGSP